MADKQVSPTQRVLNVWAVILIIWSIYRANLHLPEWFDEFIAKPTVFILPVFYYISVVEKKEFFSSLWFSTKKIFGDIVWATIIGSVFFGSILFANFLKAKQIGFNGSYGLLQLILIILMALATAASEEILSRGFVLKRLYEDSKNIYTSSFFASVLFFFLHVPMLFTNIRFTGNLILLFMATDMILSLVNSFAFLQRRSLIVPILIHAFYNLSIILFI